MKDEGDSRVYSPSGAYYSTQSDIIGGLALVRVSERALWWAAYRLIMSQCGLYVTFTTAP